MSAADKSIQLSAREMEVLALAWQCMEAQPKVRPNPPTLSTFTLPYPSSPTPSLHPNTPQIDMQKLAALTGYTPGTASVTFGNIKRKIKLLGEGLAAAGPATPKGGGPGRGKAAGATPRSSAKRSAAKATEEDGTETPTKRPKKSPPKKAARNADDDDDEEFDFGKVKKEELNDINTAADGFYAQASAYAYPDES
jgi:hypothetical protein